MTDMSPRDILAKAAQSPDPETRQRGEEYRAWVTAGNALDAAKGALANALAGDEQSLRLAVLRAEDQAARREMSQAEAQLVAAQTRVTVAEQAVTEATQAYVAHLASLRAAVEACTVEEARAAETLRSK